MEGIKNQMPNIMKLLKALIFAYLVTALCLLILAVLLYKLELGEGQVAAGIVAVYILSCFLGGFFLGKHVENRKFIWGIILGAIYFLFLLGISLILEPGGLAGTRTLLTSMTMCLGGGMLGGMLSGT